MTQIPGKQTIIKQGNNKKERNKIMKKTFAILLSLALMLSLAVPAMAAETTKGAGVTGNASITVNLPEVPENATADNTYKIYKVFDATTSGDNISYKLVSGKTTAPEGFSVDTAGNVTYAGGAEVKELTAADISSIARYVTEKDLVATVTTTTTDKSFTVDGLPYGYYYITTTTGSVVTINSTKPDAIVSDKNEIPTLDKKITGASSVDQDGKKALAQVGTSVEYTVTIEVKKGAINYEFHDKMENVLKYNNDVEVKVDNTVIAETNYNKTTVGDDTITIKFDNTWISTQVGKTITITYSATITSDALHTDPTKNTAWLEYGDTNSTNKTPVKETEVYNAKFTVSKKDGDGKSLAGAGFVIKNSVGKYYKLTDNVVTWVDSIEDADEHTSDANGAVPAFTGLANGTYTLIEKTVPAGYNKAADSTFTIAEHDYTAINLQQATDVVNNAGSILPETGGMGTTIFYIVGGVMVAAAVVLLITKKRMSAEG